MFPMDSADEDHRQLAILIDDCIWYCPHYKAFVSHSKLATCTVWQSIGKLLPVSVAVAQQQDCGCCAGAGVWVPKFDS